VTSQSTFYKRGRDGQRETDTLVYLPVLPFAGGENSWFKIVRGVNNMRFEEECVFALFDASDLMHVLEGRWRGGMFGLVDQPPPKVTEVAYENGTTEAHNANKHSKKKKKGHKHGKPKGRSNSAARWHMR